MTKAHTLSASQVAAFPNVLRSQETIEPMMPGRAAAALSAKLARARPRACRCFFISLTPPLSDDLGAGDGVPPAPPPVRARTTVLIAMPIALRMLAIVIPCSRKRVRSASVLSSWRSRLMVSRILLICFVRGEGIEPRLPFKLDVGKLAFKLLHSVSNILLNSGVVRFGQFSAFPGQVLFDFGFPVVGGA